MKKKKMFYGLLIGLCLSLLTVSAEAELVGIDIMVDGFDVPVMYLFEPADGNYRNLGGLADGLPTYNTVDTDSGSFGLNFAFICDNEKAAFGIDGAGDISFTGWDAGGAGLKVTVDNNASPRAVTISSPVISVALEGFGSTIMYLYEPVGGSYTTLGPHADGVPGPAASVGTETFALNFWGILGAGDNVAAAFYIDDELPLTAPGSGDICFDYWQSPGSGGLAVTVDNTSDPVAITIKVSAIMLTLDGFSSTIMYLQQPLGGGGAHLGPFDDGVPRLVGIEEETFGLNFLAFTGNEFARFGTDETGIYFDGWKAGGDGLRVTVDNTVSPVAVTIGLYDISVTLEGFSSTIMYLQVPLDGNNTQLGAHANGVPGPAASVAGMTFGLNFWGYGGVGDNVFARFGIDAADDVSFTSWKDPGSGGLTVTVDNTSDPVAITITALAVSISLDGFSSAMYLFEPAFHEHTMKYWAASVEPKVTMIDIEGTGIETFSLNFAALEGNENAVFDIDGAGDISFSHWDKGGLGLEVEVDNTSEPVTITISVPKISITLDGFGSTIMYLQMPLGGNNTQLGAHADGVPGAGASISATTFGLNFWGLDGIGDNTFARFGVDAAGIYFDSWQSTGNNTLRVEVDNSSDPVGILISSPFVSITLDGFSLPNLYLYAPDGGNYTNLGAIADGDTVVTSIATLTFGLNFLGLGGPYDNTYAVFGIEGGDVYFDYWNAGDLLEVLTLEIDNSSHPLAITLAVDIDALVEILGDEVDDLVSPDANYRNHGAYVSAVAQAADDLISPLLTDPDGIHSAIVSERARSDVGKPPRSGKKK